MNRPTRLILMACALAGCRPPASPPPSAGSNGLRTPAAASDRPPTPALAEAAELLPAAVPLPDWLVFPGARTQGRPEAVVRPGPGEELVHLVTEGGEPVVARFGPDGGPRADAASRPTLLFFYGNGMCLATSGAEFDLFRRLGCNVLIPDYLGYGMSGGEASEAGCYATADAAYAHLAGRRDVDGRRIVVAGRSLGAAVAVDLATRRRVVGLITLSGFTRLADVAHAALPLLPAAVLTRCGFESEAKMGRVRAPALIVHGAADDLVPLAMADRLAAAAGGRATVVEVRGAGHNDVLPVGGRPLREALRGFLLALPARAE